MDKLCDLSEAVSQEVKDGMAVAMGCGLESLSRLRVVTKSSGKRKGNSS